MTLLTSASFAISASWTLKVLPDLQRSGSQAGRISKKKTKQNPKTNKQTKYIDTAVQKARIHGSPVCLEHMNMIWYQIQTVKRNGRDLHVMFLDPSNAFSTVPHNLLGTAFDYFKVLEAISRTYSYAWRLRCWRISAIAFTMALEVIIRASRWVLEGRQPGPRLLPFRAYMDDVPHSQQPWHAPDDC